MNSLLAAESDLEAHVGNGKSNPPADIVLIGCGAVGRLFYQPALLELSRCGELRVAALVDPAESTRAVLGERYPEAQSVSALENAGAPAGSLAIIASPPRLHAEHTLAALARGWHVLCEKPMATTSVDCEKMIRAAAISRRLLAVGHYKRFFPASAYLRELIQEKTLGPLRSFNIQEGGPFRWPAASPSFFRREETPGGVLLDIGVHVIDLLLWWLGEPAAFEYSDDAMGGLEANAVLDLSFTTGTTGRIQLSRDWTTRQLYHFEFEHGTVDWTVNQANGLTLKLNGLGRLAGTLVNSEDLPAYTNPQSFIAQLQNVLGAMRNEQALLVNGREGARAVQLIEACYSRRQLLAQPWLEPAELGRARQFTGVT